MKKGAFYLRIGIFVAALILGSVSSSVHAKTVTFGQSIMPVKMVYLDVHGEVRNVRLSDEDLRDGFYVLQIFQDAPKRVSVAHAHEPMSLEKIGHKVEVYEKQNSEAYNMEIEYMYIGGMLNEIRTYS